MSSSSSGGVSVLAVNQTREFHRADPVPIQNLREVGSGTHGRRLRRL